MGYHNRVIPKGELGKSSKIREEMAEFLDAEEQGNKILLLCELSDIVGAIGHYLKSNFEDISITDLVIMANATERAFKEGER